MKKDIHPDNYRLVVFKDTNNGEMFLIRSTAPTTETIKYTDGKEYPLVTVHISSASHPFYTGSEKLMDVEGRVDKFKARQAAAAKKQADLLARAKSKTTKTRKSTEAQKLGASAPKAA